mmetsp:Transcript_30283/g.86573  ORF Transcript_30283/g.86573 Transcript_30283/m.86573 type:complete len:106 (+) Transcript_30283:1008-1325(+)
MSSQPRLAMMQQYFLSVRDHAFSSAALAPWQSTSEVVEAVSLIAVVELVLAVVELVLLALAAGVGDGLAVPGGGAGAPAGATQPRPSWKQHHVFFASDQPDSQLE